MTIQVLPPDPKKNRPFFTATQVETQCNGYGQTEEEARQNLMENPRFNEDVEVEQWEEGVH